MTKRSKTKPVYKKVRVGTSHFLRGGAGAHVDKKKELQKNYAVSNLSRMSKFP